MNKWIKPLAFLTILIVTCSVFARVFTGGETLSDYADNHPELAYAAPEPSAEPEPDNDSSLINDMPDVSTKTASEDQYGKASVSLGAGLALFSRDAFLRDTSLWDTSLGDASLGDASLSASSTAGDNASGLNGPAGNTGYEDRFFYEPLSEELITRITGISYPVSQEAVPALSFQAVNITPDVTSLAVSYEDLCHLMVLHYDFNGDIQTGELICNKGIAQDLLEIFYELFLNEYQLEKIRLIDEYEGDDTASMLDNNTSCFNYRVVDGTESLSKHALGCAIDINPFYNPYVVFGKGENGGTYISPAGSEKYADRSWDFPYKIDENDLCYRLFKAHGFTWGGDWNSCKDYQHFQKIVS